MKKEKNKIKTKNNNYNQFEDKINDDINLEIKEVSLHSNVNAGIDHEKYKTKKKRSWEYLNEVKEYIYKLIVEKPEYLDEKIDVPRLIYPNLVKYEVNDPVNNIILSLKTLEKNYPCNLWVTFETMKKSKFTDNDGNKKPTFILRKGEKATKIGIRKFEKSVRDDVTGQYYKVQLDTPYTENVNVYNISQFKFAKGIYPTSRENINKNKLDLVISNELIEKLSEQKLENKIEKFFINQKYNIQSYEFISKIERKPFLKDLKNKKSKKGVHYSNVFKLEYCSVKAKIYMGLDLRKSEKELE